MGGVPSALGALPAISFIALEKNALTGTVASSFFASASLKTLCA
jgi:hypothetical protein